MAQRTPHAHKTALITGGCGGLGRKVAEEFLRAGANVVVIDFNETGIQDFEQNISPAYPECTLVVQGNITDEATIQDVFAKGEQKFRSIDYVVNSAGILDHLAPVGELERDIWDRVLAVNLTAPAFVSKCAVNTFLKAGTKGAIVNIGSVASTKGFAAGAAYTASKHALLGLTKNTAAAYWKQGIRSNIILAGPMKTNIGAHLREPGVASATGFGLMELTYPQTLQSEASKCDIEKMAKLVVYLCSDDASLVNGATLQADLGFTAFQ